MKTAIIYHSHSGITRRVAEELHKELPGELIEVTPDKPYSSLMVIPKGCYRAGRGLSDDVQPKHIDLSFYDLVVIACPVWVGRPTPVINGAIDTLSNYDGKNTFAIMTCARAVSGENAMKMFTANLRNKGLNVFGSIVLDYYTASNPESVGRAVKDIRSGLEKV